MLRIVLVFVKVSAKITLKKYSQLRQLIDGIENNVRFGRSKNREIFRIGKNPLMQWHINTKKKKKQVHELDAKALLPMIVMEAT